MIIAYPRINFLILIFNRRFLEAQGFPIQYLCTKITDRNRYLTITDKRTFYAKGKSFPLVVPSFVSSASLDCLAQWVQGLVPRVWKRKCFKENCPFFKQDILFCNISVELLNWILMWKSSKASPPSLNLCSFEKSNIVLVLKQLLLLDENSSFLK